MKRIFIVTDNRYIYKEFVDILKNKKIQIDFFCSPKSINLFDKEILEDKITIINLKDEKSDDILISSDYYLGFSCHSKQLFSSKLVKNITCINIHPGLNPYNRGWFPQVFSILNGLPTGVTFHFMDEEIDHGDIILQEEVKIEEYDTSLSLYNRIQKKEVELFKSNIDNILLKSFYNITTPVEGNYNSIRDYKDKCKIDLDKTVTMREAIDYLRSMTHPPYVNSYFFDNKGDKIYVSISLSSENMFMK